MPLLIDDKQKQIAAVDQQYRKGHLSLFGTALSNNFTCGSTMASTTARIQTPLQPNQPPP
jgi:hypothetical protein